MLKLEKLSPKNIEFFIQTMLYDDFINKYNIISIRDTLNEKTEIDMNRAISKMEKGFFTWVVTKDGKNVGAVRLEKGKKYSEISYWVLEEYCRQGIATFMVKEILAKTDKLKLNTYLWIVQGNVPSMRLATKLGYSVHKSVEIKGVQVDLLLRKSISR